MQGLEKREEEREWERKRLPVTAAGRRAGGWSGQEAVTARWPLGHRFLVGGGTCPSPAFPPLTDNSCPAWNRFLRQVVSQLTLHLILTTSHCVCILMSIAAQIGKVTCPSSPSLEVARGMEFGSHWLSH